YSVTTTSALVADGAKVIVATQSASNCETAASASASLTVTLVQTSPVVASLTNIQRGPVTMDLKFTEVNAMGAGVTTPANYTLSGTGMGTLAANPDSVTLSGAASPNPTYTLFWGSGEMVGGGNLTITVANGGGGVLDA